MFGIRITDTDLTFTRVLSFFMTISFGIYIYIYIQSKFVNFAFSITNSPKSTRKLPSATAEHYISSVIQTNTNRNSPTVKTTINMPHYGGGSEKCARCTKNVYLAERRMGAGRVCILR